MQTHSTRARLPLRPGSMMRSRSVNPNAPLNHSIAFSTWFHLPYFRAKMAVEARGQEIVYFSRRSDERGRGERFEASYACEGAKSRAQPGTLDYFLTERYCLYAQRRNGRILRGEIHHAPWELRGARVKIMVNTMTENLSVALAGKPLLHFSKLQRVVVWQPQEVKL